MGDKLDLRPHCRFDTTVKQAHWDDQLYIWHITAEGKKGLYKASARYLILCIVSAPSIVSQHDQRRNYQGFTSKPYIPDIKGCEMFRGPCSHIGRWPKEGIEITGKRVGVIGTGAGGVQVIQEIGPQVRRLQDDKQ